MDKGYRERIYRKTITTPDLQAFAVTEKESDLFILCDQVLAAEATASLRAARGAIESYIRENPRFETSLSPVEADAGAPAIVEEMCRAAHMAGVGPMAAVAGAVAEYVGKDLLRLASEVIVENGGDIFISSKETRIVRIFTDNPHFKDSISVKISHSMSPLGVCTSSGIIGPSLSFGKADAVTVLAASTSLADAAATALGNQVKCEEDVQGTLEHARHIEGLSGVLVIIGKKLGAWGEIELC